MSQVTLTRQNGMSIITLNRPESYNALDETTLQLLLEQLKAVKENDDNVVILTGEGKAFCAGGDIGMMQTMDRPDAFESLMDTISNIVTELFCLPKIAIAAVNGSAAGLGLSIALNT